MTSSWEDFFTLVKQTRAASKDCFKEKNNFAKVKKLEIYNQLGDELDKAVKRHEDNQNEAIQLGLEKMFDGKCDGRQ